VSAALEHARRFLGVLARGIPVTFQIFSDRSEGKVERLDGKLYDPHARVLHGTLAQSASTLARANEQGAGVFVMINAGDGKGRTAKNVVRVRALFIDTDGAPLPPATPLEPHLKVQSSPGRWHLYWLTYGLHLTDFAPLQSALAKLYGTDPAITDLPRVMRLPGFYHCKGEPVMTQLLDAKEHAPYSRREVLAAWPFLAIALDRRAELEHERVEARERVRHMPRDTGSKEPMRAEAILHRHCETIAKAGEGSRHKTLLTAAYTLGGYVGGGYLEPRGVASALLGLLRRAVCHTPKRKM
jgi:hypothetical protein